MNTKKSYFTGKNVLITGGTGSFGRAMTQKLITEDNPNKVIIFSRDEWKQWQMKRSHPVFSDSRMRYFLGDVRDSSRLIRAFNEVDIVIHAAALKQVPAAEYNPTEFIKTNVLGAMNIIDASIDAGIKKVIALSTDKAVNPVNLYGASKLCSDKLFVAGNSYVGAKGYPTFSVVRYGNVAASRGSLIPYWLELLSQGAPSLPITDQRMTRFWITLEESVKFVAERTEQAQGWEIFVPKIPSFNVIDVARAIAPNTPLENIGIREGEKLHELMVSSDDSRHTLEYKDYYAIIPELFYYREDLMKRFCQLEKPKPLPENFAYASNTNSEWLNVDELKKGIQPLVDFNKNIM